MPRTEADNFGTNVSESEIEPTFSGARARKLVGGFMALIFDIGGGEKRVDAYIVDGTPENHPEIREAIKESMNTEGGVPRLGRLEMGKRYRRSKNPRIISNNE